MTASGQRYYTPYSTAFDAVGVVSPGAQLFFYQTGTSTPQNTYSDAALTMPNSNPVVANGAGLFGSIFLTPGLQYKVVLEDANNDQIWTADPVYIGAGQNITYVSNIAALEALGSSSSFFGVVFVEGYNTAGDNGGGIFLWVSASTATPDGGVTFAASGVTTGRWIRQLNGQPITVDMFGAYSDGTHTATTLAAFQAANDYVAASSNPCQTILIPGASYNFGSGGGVVKASSFFAPNWIGNGASTGAQGTLITYTPAAEGAAFTFVGGSGAICNGGIKGVIFTGNSNSIAVELQGQGGAKIDIAIFTPMKRAVLLNNKLSGQFTEFNQLTINSNGYPGIGTVLEYRVGSGNVSFHGSGLIGGVINFDGGSNPAILVNTGAFPYNAPLSGTFFPNTGNCTIIEVANTTSYGVPWFFGNLHAELGGATSLTAGSTSDFLYNGKVSSLGALALGTLFQTSFIQSESSSLRALWFGPINLVGTTTGATTTIPWPANAGHNHWFIMIETRGTNNIALASAQIFSVVGFTGMDIKNQVNDLVTNSAGYGNIVIAADTAAGISISATSTSYPAGIPYYISLTQIGQDVNNHSTQ